MSTILARSPLRVQTQPSLENTKIRPQSKLEVLPALKIKALVSSEILVNIYRSTGRQITEGCKGKAILLHPGQALRNPEIEAPRFQDNRRMKLVRLSALGTCRL